MNMTTQSKRSSTSTMSAIKASDDTPIRWRCNPEEVLRAVRSILVAGRSGGSSVEKLVNELEKKYKIQLPGEGEASKKQALGVLIRCVDPSFLTISRGRSGVQLPEFNAAEEELREALREQGVDEEKVNTIVARAMDRLALGTPKAKGQKAA